MPLIFRATDGYDPGSWAYSNKVYTLLEALMQEISDKKVYKTFFDVINDKSIPLIHDEYLNQELIKRARIWGKHNGLL